MPCTDTHMDNFFCADLSRRHHDPLHGTASEFNSLFLLEYSAPWGAKAFVDSQLPDAVKDHLRTQLNGLDRPRLLFIKRADKRDGVINMFAVNNRAADPYYNHFTLNAYDDLIGFDLAQTLVQRDTSARAPIYMVCTNGNKDKCCAKFGMACYKQLLAHAQSDRVWQCAHVGGDRFAPNVIVAPGGHYFGHVGVDDVETLITDVESHQITLAVHRGRSCYPKHVQSAEYYLRQAYQNSDMHDLELVTAQCGEMNAEVTFRELSTDRQITVAMDKTQTEEAFFLTCQATTQGKATYYMLTQITCTDTIRAIA